MGRSGVFKAFEGKTFRIVALEMAELEGLEQAPVAGFRDHCDADSFDGESHFLKKVGVPPVPRERILEELRDAQKRCLSAGVVPFQA